MIPSAFVWLEALPLTVNGKLDRKALPDPEFGTKGSDSYAPPRNEMEAKLCSIWEDVLGLPSSSVGIKDDFFRLGGDSILAIRLVSRVNNSLQLPLKVADIFKFSRIEKLTFYIGTKLEGQNTRYEYVL
jgi:acyl carrier protein